MTKIMKFDEIIDLLQALAPYALGIFIVFYGWLKIHYPDMAKKLEAIDDIAENAYAHQSIFNDKSGSRKMTDAIDNAMEQAKKSHIHTTRANMAGAIQKAYDNNNPEPIQESKPVENKKEVLSESNIPDKPIEVK